MDLNDKKIMLVDDDAICNLISKKTLERMGIDSEITVALNGAEAMDILNEIAQQPDSYPDIIFLDLNMPVKNGIECLKEIRNDSKLDKLPIIVYTTSDNPRDIDTCYDLKANLYVVKPTSFESIIKTLKKIINIDFKNQDFPARENFILESA